MFLRRLHPLMPELELSSAERSLARAPGTRTCRKNSKYPHTPEESGRDSAHPQIPEESGRDSAYPQIPEELRKRFRTPANSGRASEETPHTRKFRKSFRGCVRHIRHLFFPTICAEVSGKWRR